MVQAGELPAAALSTLEDWLLHTGDGVLDELAFFAYRHTYHPRLAVADLVDHLGRTSSALNRAATTATNPNTRQGSSRSPRRPPATPT